MELSNSLVYQRNKTVVINNIFFAGRGRGNLCAGGRDKIIETLCPATVLNDPTDINMI